MKLAVLATLAALVPGVAWADGYDHPPPAVYTAPPAPCACPTNYWGPYPAYEDYGVPEFGFGFRDGRFHDHDDFNFRERFEGHHFEGHGFFGPHGFGGHFGGGHGGHR
jgi:hypothetical protein